ncbi:hypothetical protein BACUNI_03586 [Bacteroides uniformis ATCC 8492]|uniref:Uncharacterized protein n=1 Tax=Bacteroides uniformis (strain ATCC 8492 / DSM 6597 / CCUG 4942 / CIP 103695 / JCM 5828 / KCTC 5204 / NCTC 13054 / VPI 0061) TaxID=411479 RepID=A0ABC9N7R8_BACUC|nr:hypothetical protein BACUNI_03586 [Bacteroides uniformis ATCC 8492]
MLICFPIFSGEQIYNKGKIYRSSGPILFFLNRKSPSCFLGAKQGRASVTHR